MALVDLTEAEMKLVLTRIEAASSHGVETPEDQSVRRKLSQHLSNTGPVTAEDVARRYRGPI